MTIDDWVLVFGPKHGQRVKINSEVTYLDVMVQDAPIGLIEEPDVQSSLVHHFRYEKVKAFLVHDVTGKKYPITFGVCMEECDHRYTLDDLMDALNEADSL